MTFDQAQVGTLIVPQPRRHKLKTNEYQTTGAVPIVDQGSEFFAGFTDDLERCYAGPLPVIVFGDHTCCLKYVHFAFAIGADGTQVLRPVEGLDARYLYYALHTAELEQFGYQRHFKLLKECSVAVPPLDTQRRIASILGAYDDLIEVNRRRVAVLEEMAHGLFEEWFVRFRFPCHDSVPFVETPDGPLPQGWSTLPFGELFEQTIGGLWGEADASDEDNQPVRVIRGTDFPRLLSGDFESVPKRFVKAKELRKRTIAAGDLILEASGGSKDQPVGRTQFVTHGLLEGLGNVVAPASFCRKLRPKTQPGLAEYAHGLLLAMYEDRRIEKFQKQSTGLRNLSMRQLEAEPITVPAASHLAAFGSTMRPLLDAMSIHRNEMRLLRCSRDMLLPRLVSGQLSVEAAERDLELAA